MRNIEKKNFHIGMRIVKTAVSIFICYLIGMVWPESLLQSTMTVVICLKASYSESIKVGKSRIFGTIYGGFVALLMILLCDSLGIAFPGLLYGLISCFFLIFLIKTVTMIKQADATVITAIVFLVIAYQPHLYDSPLQLTLERIAGTLLGIVVSIIVNILLPTNHLPEEYKDEEVKDKEEKEKLEKMVMKLIDQEKGKPKEKKERGDVKEKIDRGEKN